MGGKTKVIGFAITLVFLALILWKIDFPKLGEALASANYAFVLPAAVCTLSSYGLRTFRWRMILAPTKLAPVRRLFPVLMIGFMANNVLPARLGEFVRAYVLGRKENVSKSLGFATVMLERLLDGITLLAFLLGLSFLMVIPGWGLGISYVGTIVFAAAALFVVVVLLWEGFAKRILNRALRPLPRRIRRQVADKAAMFVVGLHSLRSTKTVVVLVALSALVWSIETAYYFLLLRGFGIAQGGEGIRAAVLVLVVVNLGIMIPSAPGYVGTYHALAVLALSAFGVDSTHAFSAALVMHGVQYLIVTGLGLFFFGRENLSFGQLWSAGSEEGGSDGGPQSGEQNGTGVQVGKVLARREAKVTGVEAPE